MMFLYKLQSTFSDKEFEQTVIRFSKVISNLSAVCIRYNGGRHRIQSLSTNSCFDEVELESHNVANRPSPLLSFSFIPGLLYSRGADYLGELRLAQTHELSETWVTYIRNEKS